MTKFTVFALVMVLIFTFTACGKKTDTPKATAPVATQPETEDMTIPTIDPTMGTNIPDPEVDSSMPDMTDPTIGDPLTETESSAPNSGTEGNTRSGIGRRR